MPVPKLLTFSSKLGDSHSLQHLCITQRFQSKYVQKRPFFLLQQCAAKFQHPNNTVLKCAKYRSQVFVSFFLNTFSGLYNEIDFYVLCQIIARVNPVVEKGKELLFVMLKCLLKGVSE